MEGRRKGGGGGGRGRKREGEKEERGERRKRGGRKEKREMKKEAGMEERWRTTYLIPNETVITQKIFIPATHLGGREDEKERGEKIILQSTYTTNFTHTYNVGIVQGFHSYLSIYLSIYPRIYISK